MSYASINECIACVKGFSMLKDDWDTYGAKAIAPDSISRAIDIMKEIYTKTKQLPSEIVPTTQTGISVAYYLKNIRDTIEMDITPKEIDIFPPDEREFKSGELRDCIRDVINIYF